MYCAEMELNKVMKNVTMVIDKTMMVVMRIANKKLVGKFVEMAS